MAGQDTKHRSPGDLSHHWLTGIEAFLLSAQLRWTGHVIRMFVLNFAPRMYLYLFYWIVFSLVPDEVNIGEVFNVFESDLCVFTTTHVISYWLSDLERRRSVRPTGY